MGEEEERVTSANFGLGRITRQYTKFRKLGRAGNVASWPETTERSVCNLYSLSRIIDAHKTVKMSHFSCKSQYHARPNWKHLFIVRMLPGLHTSTEVTCSPPPTFYHALFVLQVDAVHHVISLLFTEYIHVYTPHILPTSTPSHPPTLTPHTSHRRQKAHTLGQNQPPVSN